MKHLMKKCPECGDYTLKNVCEGCGVTTHLPHPSKFSLEDKYVLYKIPLRKQVDRKS